MGSRIIWINPVGSEDFDLPVRKFLERAKRPDTSIDVISLKSGPKHLKYHYYEALVLVDVLHRIKQSEREGYDGCIIGCFDDPGLHEAREITEKLVITAPGESGFHIAASLAHRFTIIVNTKKCIPKMQENLANYGFSRHIASFRALGLEIAELNENRDETMRSLEAIAKHAVEEELSEAIVLGCTGLQGFYEELQKAVGVPVVDPVLAPLKYLELLIELRKRFNWGHSKAYRYESPPEKEIAEWKLEDQYKR